MTLSQPIAGVFGKDANIGVIRVQVQSVIEKRGGTDADLFGY